MSEKMETPDAAFWTMPDLTGENYTGLLRRFHQTFKPKTYLEIGVEGGFTLNCSECPSIAIDPDFKINFSVMNNKPTCSFYKMTSDSFFQQHDPTAIFGRKVDMAFLDGLHWFEFLLRDFINIEKYCKPNSIVFLHDCLPADAYVARRDQSDSRLRDISAHQDWWAGDVWKTVAILMKFRPDLKILAFDSTPTGLIAITRLDPSSTLLPDRYFDIVGDYRDREINQEGSAYLRDLKVVSSSQYNSAQALSTVFWL